MIFRRLYDPDLAQASYIIGCAASGEAIVVDPTRDAALYQRSAAADGLRITHVTETHIHADFLSGSRELARASGARLFLSGAGEPPWSYAFADEDGATLLRDGDSIGVGSVRLEVLHTPGHTPEHLSFLVTDQAAGAGPTGLLTGDFLFVGDVGRPDLLERSAQQAGTSESAARALHASLRRTSTLEDHLQIWPGHGAGSACGKALGSAPQSTLGEERRANPAFRARTEEEFLAHVLHGQPDPPPYFGRMKRENRDGPRILGGLPEPVLLGPAEVQQVLDDGALVVDTRPERDFAYRHFPAALSIPLGTSFTKWCGWLLPYDRDLYLVAEEESAAREAARRLAIIGLDRVRGWIDAEVIMGREFAGSPVTCITQTGVGLLRTVDPRELHELQVIDVRDRDEWDAGHMPFARHIPLGHLGERIGELDPDRLVVVHCQGGGRSGMAAALLRARGFRGVLNLFGGYPAWVTAGGAVETEPPE